MAEKLFQPRARAAIPLGFSGQLPLEGLATLIEPLASNSGLRADGLHHWLVLFDGEKQPTGRWIHRDMLL